MLSHDTEIFKRDEYEDLVTRNGFCRRGLRHRAHRAPLPRPSMKQWFLSELQESLATSAHDVQMVLNYLAQRGDLDMNRVGMFTQGSGASIASSLRLSTRA